VRLAPRTFQIWWDVHAWVGVIGALVLYLAFFMGALTLFNAEIDMWADPVSGGRPATAARLGPLVDQLVREEHAVGQDRMALMPERTGLRAYLVKRGQSVRAYRMSSETGRFEPLRSELGQFFFGLHYLAHVPGGVYLAGLAAMSLLLVAMTGLFIHLKNLARQWLRFRPARGLRPAATDAHKVLGLFGLPFQLLYGWTGALLAIGFVLVEPPFVASLFAGDVQAAAEARGEPADDAPRPTGHLAPLADIDQVVATARGAVPGLVPSFIGVDHVGDEASVIRVSGEVERGAFGTASVVVRARDGKLLHAYGPEQASSFQRFEAWFFGLHYARYGGYGLKLVSALLALLTCAVIVTGNLIWLERRDRKRARVSNRVLERLTVAVCAGLPAATAAMVAANRLLDADAASRIAHEKLVFWLAWAAAAVVAFAWRDGRRAGGGLLVIAGGLFALTPISDIARRPDWISCSVRRTIAVVLGMVALACVAGGLRLLHRRRPGPLGAVAPPAPVPGVVDDDSIGDLELE
jgi:uncharacterized iron-regulated membrane protein